MSGSPAIGRFAPTSSPITTPLARSDSTRQFSRHVTPMGASDDLPAAIKCDETAWSFFQRIHATKIHTGLRAIDELPESSLSLLPGHVLDVCGGHGSGKSQFLMSLAAQALVDPSNPTSVVVWIDCASRTDVTQLREIVSKQLSYQTDSNGGDVDARIAGCMKRFLITRPQSSLQLLSTLIALSLQPPKSLRCVLIEDACVYRWQDKCWELGSGEALNSHIAQTLQRLSSEHAALIAFTRPAVASKGVLSGEKVMLPYSWLRLVTHRLRFVVLGVTPLESDESVHVTVGTVAFSAVSDGTTKTVPTSEQQQQLSFQSTFRIGPDGVSSVVIPADTTEPSTVDKQ